ncbi:uncharacterized protein [Procambarus clarkii]|uniref:uncharacterized protein n=1 Tax=Procambarus clarkii TaxID=6728 RepID=UPI0037433518
MGDINHETIDWVNLTSQEEGDQFLDLVQDFFLIQYVVEPTRGNSILDFVLTSEESMIDQIKVGEKLTLIGKTLDQGIFPLGWKYTNVTPDFYKRQKELGKKLPSDQLDITHLQTHGENLRGKNHLTSQEWGIDLDAGWMRGVTSRPLKEEEEERHESGRTSLGEVSEAALKAGSCEGPSLLMSVLRGRSPGDWPSPSADSISSTEIIRTSYHYMSVITTQCNVTVITTQCNITVISTQCNVTVITTQCNVTVITTQCNVTVITTQCNVTVITTQCNVTVITTQCNVTVITTQCNVTVISTQCNVTVITTQCNVTVISTQCNVTVITTQCNVTVITTQCNVTVITTQCNVTVITTHCNVTVITTQCNVTVISTQCNVTVITTQCNVTVITTQCNVTVISTQCNITVITTQCNVTVITTQCNVTVITTQCNVTVITTQCNVTVITTQCNVTVITTQCNVTVITTQCNVTVISTQCNITVITTQCNVTVITTQCNVTVISTQCNITVITTQCNVTVITTQCNVTVITTQCNVTVITTQCNVTVITTHCNVTVITTQCNVTVITTHCNVTVITTQCNVTVITTQCNITVITTQCNVTVITTQCNVTVITTHCNVTVITTQCNVTVITTQCNVTVITTLSNVTVISTQCNVTVITTVSSVVFTLVEPRQLSNNNRSGESPEYYQRAAKYINFRLRKRVRLDATYIQFTARPYRQNLARDDVHLSGETELEDIVNDLVQYEDDIQVKLQPFKKQIATNKLTTTSTAHPDPDVKLPQINIPTFSGNDNESETELEDIVNDLVQYEDDIQVKLQPFKKLIATNKLTTTSTAHPDPDVKLPQINIPTFSGNDNETVQLLKTNYDNKERTITILVQKLLDLPSANNSTDSLQTFRLELESLLKELSLKVQIQTAEWMTKVVVRRKLPRGNFR